MADDVAQKSRMAQIVLILGEGLATAEVIAGHVDVSIRTVYRDIARLKASGEPVEGSRGVGYMLRRKDHGRAV